MLYAYILCLKRTVSCVYAWLLNITISRILCTVHGCDIWRTAKQPTTNDWTAKCHTNKIYKWTKTQTKIFIKPKVMCVPSDIIANWMELESLTGARITLFHWLTVSTSVNHSKIANEIHTQTEHFAFFKDWNGQQETRKKREPNILKWSIRICAKRRD